MFCPVCRRVRPRFTMVDKAAGKDWEKLPLGYICIHCRCDNAGKLDYLMGTDRLQQVIACCFLFVCFFCVCFFCLFFLFLFFVCIEEIKFAIISEFFSPVNFGILSNWFILVDFPILYV